MSFACRNVLLPDPVTGRPTQRRIVPQQYRDKFNNPQYNDVAESTKDVSCLRARVLLILMYVLKFVLIAFQSSYGRCKLWGFMQHPVCTTQR
jgi:hypothetical protein